MNFRRVKAVARKEFLHIFRDPRSLGMAIAIPMLMLILFGFALTVDVDDVPMVVWDQGGSNASEEFVSRFDGSPYFSLVGYVHSYREIEEAVDQRRAMIGLVLPDDFAERVESGRQVGVQLVVDATDANKATIAIGYAEAIAAMYSQQSAIDAVRRMGGPQFRPPLEVRPRVWFNEDMESRNYIIPGLIAVIMMVIAALLTSLTVAREWERGTMEQLIATPVKGPELILGKLIPYFAIGMLDVTLAVLMGEFVFHVPLRGNVGLIFGMAAIFLAGALSMGMLISIVAKSQLLASQMAMVSTFLPAFLLSGFIVPIHNMPVVIRGITHIVPARYFVAILHGIYLKGVGLEILGLDALLLVVYGVVIVLVANVKFKKRLM
jgi:ABC-2 type transport system permease protein